MLRLIEGMQTEMTTPDVAVSRPPFVSDQDYPYLKNRFPSFSFQASPDCDFPS